MVISRRTTRAFIAFSVIWLGALPASSQQPQPASPQASLGAGLSYQGQLRRDGRPHTGACDFEFSLWDAAAGGSQFGATQSLPAVAVSGGLFTVGLNDGDEFGPSPFTGEARWLEVAVQCAGDAGFSTLAPRTTLAAAPYALGLRPGAVISGTGPLGLQVNTPNGNAIVGYSRADAYASVFGGDSSPGGGFGVAGLSAAGTGVYGQGGPLRPGVTGYQTYTNSIGVWGEANNTGSVGVYGKSISNTGVYGVSSTGNGMWAQSSTGDALRADSSSGSGIVINAGGAMGVGVDVQDAGLYGVRVMDAVTGVRIESAGTGVRVGSTTNEGVYVAEAGRDGVYARSLGATYAGVYGWNTNANSLGVKGVANAAGSVGVWGESTANTGVYGLTTTGNGVWGASTGSGRAGYFQGNVQVTGNLSKGGGSFKIDHPLDPANKYLYHSFVESPDMMNIYNGNVTTDAKGFAEIDLPEWFEALNKDFRYQLTVVGQFAQAIIAKEIEKNRFVIQTDKPKVKVSWQVTGIRKDAYANAHRIPVEEDKPAAERGTYLHPEAQRATPVPAPGR